MFFKIVSGQKTQKAAIVTSYKIPKRQRLNPKKYRLADFRYKKKEQDIGLDFAAHTLSYAILCLSLCTMKVFS